MLAMQLSAIPPVPPVHKNRLFVGDLPRSIDSDTVKRRLWELFPTAKNVEIYSDASIEGPNNRGFAFVSYENSLEAEEIRNKYMEKRPIVFNQPLSIDWAQVEPEVSDDIMKMVKVLFVRNISRTVSDDDLKTHLGGVEAGITKVKIQKNFAFVHFEEREQANIAMEKYHGTVLHDHTLDIQWSKPQPAKQLKMVTRSPSNPLVTSPYVIPNRQPVISNLVAQQEQQLQQHQPYYFSIFQQLQMSRLSNPLVNPFMTSTASTDPCVSFSYQNLQNLCMDNGWTPPMLTTIPFVMPLKSQEMQYKSVIVLWNGVQLHSQVRPSAQETETEVLTEAYKQFIREFQLLNLDSVFY